MRRGLVLVAALAVARPAAAATVATLATSEGDGGLMVDVDAYGAFGSSVFALQEAEAMFDPVGSVGLSGTTYESALFLKLPTSGVYLTSGKIGPSHPGDLPDRPFTLATGAEASSTFTQSGLEFHLIQDLFEAVDGSSSRVGSILRQEYTVTNTTAGLLNFALIRYFDGDLLDGTTLDGGGRVLFGDHEFLFETDVAGAPTTATSLVGITACGGNVLPTAGRYEVSDFPGLGGVIHNRLPLGDTVENDGADTDQLVDAGLDYDVTLALSSEFSLPAGGVVIYTTTTLFGTLAPGEAGNLGCDALVEEVDSDGDGVPDPDDTCPGFDDTPADEEDYDGDGVHDECDPCPLGDASPPCSTMGPPATTSCDALWFSSGPAQIRYQDGPDLAVEIEDSCFECTAPGTTTQRYYVWVRNHGTASAATQITAYRGPPSLGDVVWTDEVPALGMGHTAPLMSFDVPDREAAYVVAVAWDPEAATPNAPDEYAGNNLASIQPWGDESDTDGDGEFDACDDCPTGTSADDADGDGVPDGCDACDGPEDDWDHDRTPDACDPCPLVRGEPAGEACRVSVPQAMACAFGPEAEFDARPGQYPPCTGYDLVLHLRAPCRDCSAEEAEREGFFFSVSNEGQGPAPASTIEILSGPQPDARVLAAIDVPPIESFRGRNVGPVYHDTSWWSDGEAVLAVLTPDESAEASCLSAEVVVSPPENAVCLDPPARLPCLGEGTTVDPAGGLPALALLWVAMAWRRRRPRGDP